MMYKRTCLFLGKEQTCFQKLFRNSKGNPRWHCAASTLETSALLHGITVCDLTSMTAGPHCTMVLGDMGAQVIKVENTEGDVSRQWGPPFIQTESNYYLAFNRNKKSIAVDFNNPEGKDVIQDLVKKSDVFVESLTPGELDRLGLGYRELSCINPSLVYCSISGYGAAGSNIPGDGSVASALSGFMSITGPNNGPACVVGAPLLEIMTGMNAHGAIVAALLERNLTNKGRRIETSLLDTQITFLSHIASSYLNAGVVGNKYGTAHASIVPYQAFRTSDKMIIIAAGNDDQFRKVCQVLASPCLASDDERFTTNARRVVNRSALLKLMDKVLMTKKSDYWLNKLEAAAVPCGPVNSIGDVFELNQVEALGLVKEVSHPQIGLLKILGSAIDIDGQSLLSKLVHPPMLGEHTEEILKNVLNYTDEKYSCLLENNVING